MFILSKFNFVVRVSRESIAGLVALTRLAFHVILECLSYGVDRLIVGSQIFSGSGLDLFEVFVFIGSRNRDLSADIFGNVGLAIGVVSLIAARRSVRSRSARRSGSGSGCGAFSASLAISAICGLLDLP